MNKDEFDKLVETNNKKFRKDNKHLIDRFITIVNNEIQKSIDKFKYIPQQGNFRIDCQIPENIPKELIEGLVRCVLEDLSVYGWEINSFQHFSTSFYISLKL